MSLFTKPANDVFAPTDAAGSPRPVPNQDAQRWGTELERILATGGFSAADAAGPFADRSDYDAEGAGFVYISIDGDGGTVTSTVAYVKEAGSGNWSDPIPFQGAKGWSPLLRIVNDGARRVLEIYDWTGGDGAKPTTTGYIGAAGLTATIADAIDVRGPAGPSGSGTGDMLASVYDPNGTAADAFDSANHAYDNTTSGATADTVQAALDEFALSRAPAVATRTALKALPTAIGSAYLTEAGREGPFIWKAATAALQSQMVVKSATVTSVDPATDTFRMNEVVTSSFDPVTNTFTAPGHGFTSGQQVIIPTTRNAFQGAGLYYIGSDVTANTFRLYTSPGTAALAGTSGLCQIGVASTSVVSNTIGKILHGWADGTLVHVAEAVNGLSTGTDYYVKTSNVNNFTLSLTEGGSDVVLAGTDQ